MTKQYDLIAIGTGTGASGAAAICRKAGWKVAVVDNLPFGGTCALRGCLPKKVLLGVAQALDHSRRMRGKSIGGVEPSIAWNEPIEFKRTFTEPVPAMRGADSAKKCSRPISWSMRRAASLTWSRSIWPQRAWQARRVDCN